PALRQVLPSLTAEFGAPDILINNAGMAAMVPAVDCSLDHWQTTMAVNVTAPMLLMQHALPHMRQAGWGRIVNVASISGLRAGTLSLASDQASYITGQTLAIDGGFTAAGVLVSDLFSKTSTAPRAAAVAAAREFPHRQQTGDT